MALKVMKTPPLLPSLIWGCLVSWFGVPTLIVIFVPFNIFFPIGKMIGTVRLRTSIILSFRSWEIGCHLTGGAGSMKLSCVVLASVTYI